MVAGVFQVGRAPVRGAGERHLDQAHHQVVILRFVLHRGSPSARTTIAGRHATSAAWFASSYLTFRRPLHHSTPESTSPPPAGTTPVWCGQADHGAGPP